MAVAATAMTTTAAPIAMYVVVVVPLVGGCGTALGDVVVVGIGEGVEVGEGVGTVGEAAATSPRAVSADDG